jgi:hypothetical protein
MHRTAAVLNLKERDLVYFFSYLTLIQHLPDAFREPFYATQSRQYDAAAPNRPRSYDPTSRRSGPRRLTHGRRVL